MKTYCYSTITVNTESELSQQQRKSLVAAIQEEFELGEADMIEGEDTKPAEHWNWAKRIVRKSAS